MLGNFFKEGAPKFAIFLSIFFLAESFSILIIKKALGGSGGMLPRKLFENLHTVVAILALFEQFLVKFKFFAPKSECFTKFDAFCSYIFEYAC